VERRGYTTGSKEPVMLDPVKILPGSFLITSEPVNPGASEVPPEISMGHFPLENRRTARDGA